MKVLLFSDPSSAHTIKWANGLAGQGIKVVVFGFSSFNKKEYDPSITVSSSVHVFDRTKQKTDGSFQKISYLKLLPELKKIIKFEKPDILHAHYASSYGLIGALSSFHPYIISVYGADVYNFPRKNIFTKKLLVYNLSKADKILSTSHVMMDETKLYTSKKIEVTPFGINTSIFSPMNTKELIFSKEDVIIGTVKTLEKKYGIDYLIKAFKLVKDRNPQFPLKLLIVGKGSKEFELKNLVNSLQLDEVTKFTGFVNYSESPKYHNMIDISVFPSVENSESFGVSVLEASACEKPVIVSNVGGLPEVVENGKTGFIVNSKDEQHTSRVIEQLLLNKELRMKLGVQGRKRVIEKFQLDECVHQMITIYSAVLKRKY